MAGGAGADTFVSSETGSANIDHIVDFNAAEGDKLDLQALLDANFNSGSNMDDFVKLTQDGSNITVAVDTDGTGNGPPASAMSAPWTTTALRVMIY